MSEVKIKNILKQSIPKKYLLLAILVTMLVITSCASYAMFTVTEEKNNAYNSLMALQAKKTDEEKIEKKIKQTFSLDSFAKIKNDTISIVIASTEHSNTIANNIIRTVSEMFDEEKYITVKFQNA